MVIAAGIAITISIILYDGGLESPYPERKIGIVVNPPTQSVTLRDLDVLYQKASSTRAGHSNVYIFWDLIEPERGQFEWAQYDTLMGLHEKHGLRVTLFLSIINGKTLGPFPDWVGDQPLRSIPGEHLAETIDSILSRYHIVDHLIISGGTDEHFRYKSHEIPIYEELFDLVYRMVKVQHPDVKIGNSFELHNILNKNLEETARKLSFGDFVALTYMPIDTLGDINRTPQQAAIDLERALEIFPDKRIAFLEVGWSTSEFVGGSVEDQAEFARVLHDFYIENVDEIEFITWYRMYDRPEGMCGVDESVVQGTVTLGNSTFVVERLNSYICSAGLLTIHDSAKPAWTKFLDGIP